MYGSNNKINIYETVLRYIYIFFLNVQKDCFTLIDPQLLKAFNEKTYISDFHMSCKKNSEKREVNDTEFESRQESPLSRLF